jgi:hypothetical protein
MSGSKAFSRLLEEALEDAGSLRENVALLSTEVLTGEPPRIFQAAMRLEGETDSGRAVLERLLAILARAHLHTLGSAYAALRATKGREQDAERMRRLIAEYREAKAIMGMAAGHIDAAIASLGDARPEAIPAPTGEREDPRQGALLAKA